MLSKEDLLALYDREQRTELRLPGLTYETTGRVIRDTSLEDAAGYIDYADLDETSANAEIDAQVAYFQGLGLPFSWKVFDHDRPADLRQRLAARGFEIESPDALLILDLQEASGEDAATDLPALRPVTDQAGVEAIVRLEEQVWQGKRDWLRRFLAHMLDAYSERISLFGVSVEGQLVAAAWILFYPGSSFARLLGGSTLTEFRGRGFYTALLAARMREARSREVRFLTVDASPMSQPILERRGFRCLGYSRVCRWKPKG